MTKSSRIGLASFCVLYIALSLLAAWLAPDKGWLASLWVTYLPVNGVIALCTVLVGLSVGRLNITGTAICSLLIYVVVLVVTVGLLVALSSRGRGTIVWPPLLWAELAREWLGWLAGLVAGVAWPVVWLLVVRRLSPRLAPSLSS